MSLRPGLLGSTSRTLVALGALSAQGLHPASAARAFSASAIAAQTQPKKTEASVQAADQQTKDRERLMRRLPMGIDMSGMYDKIIFEPIADPDFKPIWLVKSGGIGYAWSCIKRWFSDIKYADEAGVRGLFPGPAPKSSRIMWLTRLPARTYPQLMPALEDIYTRYQAAQATGDLATIKATSMGAARERASRVAGAVRGAKWELVKHNQPPRYVSIRAGAIDVDETEVAVQVVVRFDTLQQLTARGKTKSVNVVENVVFDKRETAPAFAIKDTIATATPEFLQ